MGCILCITDDLMQAKPSVMPVEEATIALLALSQRLFRLLALGDISPGYDSACDLTIFIKDGSGIAEDREKITIGSSKNQILSQ